jgi:hypothetical protein
MGLMEKLPSPESISGGLAAITGDEGSGTGVAGVLKLLKGLDTPNMSASLAVKLDGHVSASASFDSGGAAGDISGLFGTALEALPKDGSALVGPVRELLERVRTLAASELSGQLTGGAGSLKGLDGLVPDDAGPLVAGVADKLKSLKGELITGAFGELTAWAGSVGDILGEIRPIVEAGPNGLEERLIAYLGQKAADVIKIALPNANSLADGAAGLFDSAISAPRIGEIQTLLNETVAALGKVRVEFDGGNFSNTVNLDAAEAAFAKLAAALGQIADALSAALGHVGGTAVSLSQGLEQRLKALEGVEIVDLGDIRSKLTDAIGKVEKVIDGVDFDVVRRKLDELFAKIDGALKAVDLHAVTEKIDAVQAKLEGALDSLDGAILQVTATIRSAFAKVKEALQSLVSGLGSFQPDGSFRFKVQDQVEAFLSNLKTSLHDTIEPLIGEFRTTVGGALGSVRDQLHEISGKIDEVRKEIGDALQSVADELDQADVPATLEQVRAKFDDMLSQLGQVDFSIVTGPVISEINDMRDALKKIDVSSTNEVVLGGLKISAQVVISLDFTGSITNALMAEFDKLLDYPRSALKEVETKVEGALAQLAQLGPEAILKPLNEVFEPVSELLGQLKLETLLKPLQAWRDKAMAEIEKVSPSALLKPLEDLHGELLASFDKVSPDALLKPLRDLVAELKSEITSLDFSALTAGLEGAFKDIRKAIAGIAPERLIDPLVGVFDMLMGVLDKFDPSALLKPINDLMTMLAAPLANVNPRHIELLRVAFAPLLGLSSSVDPRISYGLVSGKAQAAAGLVDQLNIGKLLASLKGGFDPVGASFKAKAGASEASLSVRVGGLNPLQNEAMAGAVARFQQLQADLKAAFPSAEPPADLVSRYEAMQQKLDSLVPIWLKRLSNPDDLRRAVEAANPLNIGAEINHLWDKVKGKFKAFDPRLLQDHVKATFATLISPLDAFDPAQLRARVEAILAHLAQKLDVLNLDVVTQELDGLKGEIRAMIMALDPKPVIQQLESLMDEVRQALAALDPVALLGELAAPFDEALASIRAFDPKTLLEPLQGIFDKIKGLVAQIDIGVVLQPLNERLDQLRDELEKALKETEEAFKGMVAALPLQGGGAA